LIVFVHIGYICTRFRLDISFTLLKNVSVLLHLIIAQLGCSVGHIFSPWKLFVWC